MLPPGSPAGVSVVEKMLNGHTQDVKCLLFHPTEPILVSAGDDAIILWDFNTGKMIQKVANKQGKRSHEGTVECLEWGVNNQVLMTGSKDTTFILWRLIMKPTPHIDFLEQITGHKGAVLALVYNQETSKVASAGRDATVKIWDCAGLDNALKNQLLGSSSTTTTSTGPGATPATAPSAAGSSPALSPERSDALTITGANGNNSSSSSSNEEEETESDESKGTSFSTAIYFVSSYCLPSLV